MKMELFELYLKASLTAAVVIALLLLATPLVRKRYPAKWRYVAWLIVAFRLLIPFNIPLPEAPIQIAVSQTVITNQEPVISIQGENVVIESADNIPVPADQGEPDFSARDVAKEISPASLAMAIWIAGMLVYFALQAITCLRFLRRQHLGPRSKVSAATQMEWEAACREAGVKHIPEIIVSGCVPAPVLTGLFRPRLLLPHDGYTTWEMRFILRHELVHSRRRDLWYKLVLMLANGIHWFNPLVYVMVSQAHKDVELSCDDAVMAGLGDTDRADYGEAILNALPVKRKWRMEPVFTTSFGSTKKTMKQRLVNLFDRTIKKRGIAALCAVMVLAATVGGLIVFTPMAAAAESTTESVAASSLPGAIKFSQSDGQRVSFGPYALTAGKSYTVAISWDEGGSRPLSCIQNTANGSESIGEYTVTSGIPLTLTIAESANYRFVIPAGEPQMTNLLCKVDIAKSTASGSMKTAVIGEDTWYLVETEAQLRAIAASEESLSRRYMQNADITVTSAWSPIGNEEHPFTGIYNGNGFAIRGLHYKENERLRGLFGCAEYAYLQNITIIGPGSDTVSINIESPLSDCAIISEEMYQATVKVRETAAQTVSFTNVELRRYSSGSPYIHDIIANNTNKRMMTNEIGMLAFDKDGNPLKLRWNYLSSSTTPQYSFLYDWGSEEIAPGADTDNEDNTGGWSLFSNTGDTPEEVEQIAYILYNFHSITFADGTVWMNPDYENWLKTYEGKQVDVSVLKGYYPHTVSIQ